MELLNQMEAIVREAGSIVLSARDIEAQTHLKTSEADMVTAYDLRVEEFLKEKLLALVPGAYFYGEEEARNADPSRGWAFVVDPIDGTANFVRQLRQSAISVALAKDGTVEYAAVLDPYRQEMFTARRGQGAFLNGSRIHVSQRPLTQGIFSVGSSPYNSSLHARTLRILTQLFEQSCDFRRMGAAALDLCAVACGRMEVFFECQLSPWDYAAGSLLVEEAGGTVSTLEHTPLLLDRKCSLWAANRVNADLLSRLDLR